MPKTYVTLAEAMNARRLELGLRWADVTARGGPSVEQMVLIRRGTVGNIRDLTLAAIAKGLDWPLEHVMELAAAGDHAEGEVRHPDPYEAAILAADAPESVKAGLIREHRERIEAERAELARLGIVEDEIVIPPSLRGRLRRSYGQPDADAGHQQRGA